MNHSFYLNEISDNKIEYVSVLKFKIIEDLGIQKEKKD
jgi:hypothetical protein